MKAMVDAEKCVGCGLCADECPEVYEMKDGKAVVKILPLPSNLEEQARKAASACPVEAINVE